MFDVWAIHEGKEIGNEMLQMGFVYLCVGTAAAAPGSCLYYIVLCVGVCRRTFPALPFVYKKSPDQTDCLCMTGMLCAKSLSHTTPLSDGMVVTCRACARRLHSPNNCHPTTMYLPSLAVGVQI